MKVLFPIATVTALAVFASSLVADDGARTAPVPIDPQLPVYPAILTDTGKSGKVAIELLVESDGTVRDARIKASDHDAFSNAALECIGGWRFIPATRDGVPIPMRITVPFIFAAPLEQRFNARFDRKVYQPLPEPAVSAAQYGRKLKLRKDVAPTYPRQLLGSGEEETVEVEFVVAPDGTTINPKTVGKPRKEFVFPALIAVIQTTYEPPTKDGAGVFVSTSRKFRISQAKRSAGDGGDSGNGGDSGGGGDFGGGDFGGGGPL